MSTVFYLWLLCKVVNSFLRWMHHFVYSRKQHLQILYALGPPCALLLAIAMVMLLGREIIVSMHILFQVQPVRLALAVRNTPPSHSQSRSLSDGLPASDAGLLGTHAMLLLPGVTISWTVLPALLAAIALAVIVHEVHKLLLRSSSSPSSLSSSSPSSLSSSASLPSSAASPSPPHMHAHTYVCKYQTVFVS